jgi:CRISPR-associated protein Cmr4
LASAQSCQQPSSLGGGKSEIVADGKVVLEEFAFQSPAKCGSEKIAEWLVKNAFPQSPEYKPFRDWLPKRFVILPDDAFRDFTQLATEVIAAFG